MKLSIVVILIKLKFLISRFYLILLQIEIGINSQRRFYRNLSNFNLSRSCFNRKAKMLLPVLINIKFTFNYKVDLSSNLLIVDSLPMSLCQAIRNKRAKVFDGLTNIGYNSTKKIYYYGFKGHFIVSDDGY